MKYVLILALLFSFPVNASPKTGVLYSYQLIKHGQYVKRLPDGVLIPKDKYNEDYQAYKLWLKNGGQPTTFTERT